MIPQYFIYEKFFALKTTKILGLLRLTHSLIITQGILLKTTGSASLTYLQPTLLLEAKQINYHTALTRGIQIVCAQPGVLFFILNKKMFKKCGFSINSCLFSSGLDEFHLSTMFCYLSLKKSSTVCAFL